MDGFRRRPRICATKNHLGVTEVRRAASRLAKQIRVRLTDSNYLSKVNKLGREAGNNSWLATAHFFRLPRLGGRTIGSTSASGADYPGSSPGLPANLLGTAGTAQKKTVLPTTGAWVSKRPNCTEERPRPRDSTKTKRPARAEWGWPLTVFTIEHPDKDLESSFPDKPIAP